MDVWNESIASSVPRMMLTETDPPELRTQGRRSEATRDSMADFTGFDKNQLGKPCFGFELKSGKSAASTGAGIGKPMSRFQLDTTDCDDILSIVAREGIPVYLLHVQVISRANPPTERFCGKGFWWTDLWSMQASFEKIQVRPRETRDAAYYSTRMFRNVPALIEHLSNGGYISDSERLARQGPPQLYHR
jgi:hypothetical protein